jgi:tetratricopeptide (TPR) repeat protein
MATLRWWSPGFTLRSMNPQIADALQQLRQLQKSGRGDEALALAQTLTARLGSAAEIWNERGNIELRLGRFRDAQHSWQTAIRLNPLEAAFHHNLGSAFRRDGQMEAAVDAYSQAVQLMPTSVESRLWLAECLLRLRQYEPAEQHFRRSIQDASTNVRGWLGLGLVLQHQKRESEAVQAYERARAIDGRHPEIHLNLGTTLRLLGRLDDAEVSLREAIRLRPEYGKAHCGLGIVHAIRGQWVEALAELSLAVAYPPASAESHDELGKALAHFERYDEALAAHREAIRIQPDYVNAWVNLGVLQIELDQFEAARQSLERAIELRSTLPEAHNNLGIAYKGLGRLTDAEACYARALELRPEYAKAHYNLGNLRLEYADWTGAMAAYERAVALSPQYAEPRFERGVVHLIHGRFTEGWSDYEWRWEMRNGRRNKRSFSIPAWRGESLVGRSLLLYAEQGFGDTLQFVRYAGVAKERGATRVVVECQPKLIPILRSYGAIDQLIPRGTPTPTCDYQAALLSMPGLCGMSLATIPAPIPYLRADVGLEQKWREWLGKIEGFRVGIAWQGSTTYLRDSSRSMPLSCFEPLARIPNVRLISLQFGAGAEQLSGVKDRFEVLELPSDIDTTAGGFMDTAAIVRTLDLSIVVDSSPAHLCGALGARCWLMLAKAPEWRWLLDREDTPWYPTMRLFRQANRGDWEEVMGRVASQLAATVSETK